MCLIRGNGNGEDAKVEICNTVEAGATSNGQFKIVGSSTVTPKLDDQGRELYTFEVSYIGSQYFFKLNGITLSSPSEITSNLNSMDSNGEFYVGVTLYSSVKDGTAAMSILNYGTKKNNASPPVGSDSKEPQPNLLKTAEIADPSTIALNQPALYWDASVVSAPNGTNIKLIQQGDNTFRAEMSDGLGFFSWNMSRSVSYSGTDFPVLNILFRNYYGDGGTVWYYGGKVLGATDKNKINWNVNEGWYVADDENINEYVLVSIDLTDKWEGRINGLRLDLSSTEESREFDICYMAFFRSQDEGDAFFTEYLRELGLNVGDADSDPETTDTVEEPNTNEAVTLAPQGTAGEQGKDKPAGCSAVVALPSVATALLIVWGLALRKKENDA